MLDQVITILLNTSMLVGGIFGFILDNTIPGMHSHCVNLLHLHLVSHFGIILYGRYFQFPLYRVSKF